MGQFGDTYDINYKAKIKLHRRLLSSLPRGPMLHLDSLMGNFEVVTKAENSIKQTLFIIIPSQENLKKEIMVEKH